MASFCDKSKIEQLDKTSDLALFRSNCRPSASSSNLSPTGCGARQNLGQSGKTKTVPADGWMQHSIPNGGQTPSATHLDSPDGSKRKKPGRDENSWPLLRRLRVAPNGVVLMKHPGRPSCELPWIPPDQRRATPVGQEPSNISPEYNPPSQDFSLTLLALRARRHPTSSPFPTVRNAGDCSHQPPVPTRKTAGPSALSAATPQSC